jgi:protein-disulfide isomerase
MTGVRAHSSWWSTYPVTLAALVCFTLTWSPALAQMAGSPSDPAWQQAVERVVEQYIRAHPEAIEQALQVREAKRQAEEQQRVKAVIAARRGELVNDPASPVGGNPAGEVTVVEFFDYRCGYCRRVAGVVTQLQKDDPRVRVVYKDLPILGEASVLAARAALASKAQGRHQVFHDALLAAEGDLSREQILGLATEAGLDAKRLETDMEKAEWSTVIEHNLALARELGITGTPAFVVGDELQVGALNLVTFKELVARAQATSEPPRGDSQPKAAK